ncbi:13649_t:CDS:2 [Entrophospora sp. SA101]|nr:13649_t:CDS:2 [Entrophospora sp. SA101]
MAAILILYNYYKKDNGGVGDTNSNKNNNRNINTNTIGKSSVDFYDDKLNLI